MKILFAADMSFNYFESLPSVSEARLAMSEAAEVFSRADFSVLNLENIFGELERYEPIIKSGPNLISDKCFLEYINALCPTAINLANNHSKDFGEEALFDTIGLLRENGYTVFGAGKNISEAYAPAVLSDGDISCAVIGVCENEFGIADETVSGTAGFRHDMVYKAIKSARERGEGPIVYFHGGNEGNPFPSPKKIELYRHFIDLGAVAVIAMHTHCPQGYEMYNGSPIIYSMGNFFFPSADRELTTWSCGYMTMLDIDRGGTKLEIIPYKFCFEGIRILKNEELTRFKKYIEFLSEEIGDSEKIQKYFDAWCMIAGLEYAEHLRYSAEIAENYDAEGIKRMKNIFSCEAHNELLTNTFKIMYEGRVKDAMELLPQIKNLQGMEI